MSNPPTSPSTDQQLVTQVLGGNTAAFGQIVQRTEGLVTQMVFKMIRHPADRPDIAQEVYLKAYKNLAGFKFQAKLSTWIGQITYNTCLHYLEKKHLVLVDPAELAPDAASEEGRRPLPRPRRVQIPTPKRPCSTTTWPAFWARPSSSCPHSTAP
ncbi:RNA polymerase sigma factor [Hymenobacter cellulosilyticus]|uniref:RNA polymerase sigma-70 region 2 domain-containing protein n=1 Tax=Hymenobacter cellulosilyticus TaxID=2932248 RepID=A0A8T9Q1V4_9BACT|nr:sigma factor [Hymenobacter cellulosilyticus]UOQ70892.1 hypothetical protein MUN79_19715 [Hymenobacter cellulosilyticus]